MCCGKMVRLPNERKRIVLTTGNMNINLEKRRYRDNNERDKRRPKQRR